MPTSTACRDKPTAIRFPFTQGQLTNFRRGLLADEWLREYPDLFDVANLRRRRSRPVAEFLKWRSAVFVRQALGRRCLVDDFLDTVLGARHEIYRARVGDAARRLIGRYPGYAPALFVFDPADDDWFLASVQAPDQAPDPIRAGFLGQLHELSQGRLLILQPEPIDRGIPDCRPPVRPQVRQFPIAQPSLRASGISAVFP
jgi:hypothetical protein